jgi:HptB-dependent secretion and biofilm anti anti-sigma factor
MNQSSASSSQQPLLYDCKVDQDTRAYYMMGHLTAYNHTIFRQVLSDIASNACKKAVLDVEKIDFIDSGGLGMLLLARDDLKKRDIALQLRHPQGNVRKILQVAKFDSLFDIAGW